MSSLLTTAPQQPPTSAHGCVVRHRDPVRGDTDESLTLAMAQPFEHTPPVAPLPVYKGQRSPPGHYWSARLGDHVSYRTRLERDTAMVLDHDNTVRAFASRPFTLSWTGPHPPRAHIPAFFARRVDGTGVVVDCRSRNTAKPDDPAANTAIRDACAYACWDHLLVTGYDPVWIENLRWLAGYRHPRHHHDGVAQGLLTAYDRPGPLMATATAVGDPLAVLPVLYHLLWNQRLHADLTLRLDSVSIVSVPR
ncbi:TnsA-like heteromeric transposase endonuclease subunit [Actinoplanes sp. M2I2]|uniref:TnsA-like heteromeric transposase endonuclease subunit n=1 Tax=Actinoplanes sp. M2I2 TaxID=1734444 RepID=UPI002021BFAF|nr:TnsA-like heteromeric transposase endonuclease subunit [Actinoplanes sp. M2I2]